MATKSDVINEYNLRPIEIEILSWDFSILEMITRGIRSFNFTVFSLVHKIEFEKVLAKKKKTKKTDRIAKILEKWSIFFLLQINLLSIPE